MLACIPTTGDSGLEDEVSKHFGSAQYFTLFDTETDEVTVVPNRNVHHDHGTCHPMNQLKRYHIDAVACAGMGRRAIQALSAEGITVYDSGPYTVEQIVQRLKDDDLPTMDPARACLGHGQRAGHSPQSPTAGCSSRQAGRGSGYGPGRGSGR
jgi:predicted Fe-Mo cluster-binding NifX family protein